MTPDVWRKLFKPRFKQLVVQVHKHEKPLILHCCGNIIPIIPDLIEIGLDGLESLQPEAMNPYNIKRGFGRQLLLIGGLGIQSTLSYGSPYVVRDETLRLINEMGEGGGYILAPAKSIPKGTPIENVIAFIETAIQETDLEN